MNTTYYVLTSLFTLLALFLVVRADWLSLQAHSHNKSECGSSATRIQSGCTWCSTV